MYAHAEGEPAKPRDNQNHNEGSTRTAGGNGEDDMVAKENKKKPNPTDVHVGSRIRLRRNMLGMSQEKLGENLGITFQQIQKYEKGANRIGASRLYEVSRVLDVPVQYFFDDMPADGDRPVARPHGFSEGDSEPFVMDFVSSSEGLALNRAYTRIKEGKLRRGILDLVRVIAGSDEDADQGA